MWLSVITLVLLMEIMDSSSLLNFNMESVLAIVAVGSVLFTVMLVIVRTLFVLLEWKNSPDTVANLLDIMTIAVDTEHNVYL